MPPSSPSSSSSTTPEELLLLLMLTGRLALRSAMLARSPAWAAPNPPSPVFMPSDADINPAPAASRREAKRADDPVLLVPREDAKLLRNPRLLRRWAASSSLRRTPSEVLSVLASAVAALLSVLVLSAEVGGCSAGGADILVDMEDSPSPPRRDEYALSNTRRRAATAPSGPPVSSPPASSSAISVLVPIVDVPVVAASRRARAPPSAVPMDSYAALPPTREGTAQLVPGVLFVAASPTPTPRIDSRTVRSAAAATSPSAAAAAVLYLRWMVRPPTEFPPTRVRCRRQATNRRRQRWHRQMNPLLTMFAYLFSSFFVSNE